MEEKEKEVVVKDKIEDKGEETGEVGEKKKKKRHKRKRKTKNKAADDTDVGTGKEETDGTESEAAPKTNADNLPVDELFEKELDKF